MKSFGYAYNVQPLGTTNTDFMFDAKARFDVGGNYELPFYSQEQYYIGRQRAAVYLGGRNQVTLTMYLIRLTFYVDFWPWKMTFENFWSYDLLGTTGASCMLGKFFTDVIRLQLYMQLDYLDCSYGILGLVVQTDENQCEW